MSFNLYYANHLDTLQHIAGYLTQIDPQPTPFDKEYFLVQNFGMARWMQIRLSEQLGILTQAEFLLPSKMLMNLIEMIFETEERQKAPIERLSKDQLFWPLVKIIDELRQSDSDNERELFAPLYTYLEKYQKSHQLENSHQSPNPLLAVMHLAETLATIFDKYIVYRSQWINAWADGQPAPTYFEQQLPETLERWQSALFQKLYNALGRPLHFGLIAPLIEEKLQDPNVIAKLPKRIFIIGLNSLPPLFLELIAQFSKVMDIHLFFNNPSQYYWGDLTKQMGLPQFDFINFYENRKSQIDPISPSLRASFDREMRLEEIQAEINEYWQSSYGNPLLASLGKVGRDHLHLLQQYEGKLNLTTMEAFSEPKVTSLLSHIQAEIFHLRPARESEKYAISDHDHSLSLHVTYSPMREVEALYNQILHLLENDPDLAPEDIVIMTPDIEQYAPFIEAIFGSAPAERSLPYAISDISLKESDTIFTTLLSLLSLPESAFKASDLLLLLQMPEMMAKFHFEEQDLSLIHYWVNDSNIKQAIDGAHLTDELQTAYNAQIDWDINTWRWGLERMLLGYSTDRLTLDYESGEQSIHCLLPYPYIEGSNAQILGRLCYFVDLLIQTKEELATERPLTEWLTILPVIWQRFFEDSSDNRDKLHYTQQIWQELIDGALAIDFNATLPLSALTALLEQKLLEEKPEQNFIQGKITFCSFIPMRTIPFKMIGMIGMNQSDFPQSTIYHNFDLMQYLPMRGDRTRNTDDRYLFLEALLSAQRYLYLSFVGRSIRDNSILRPSLLIDELLRYIDQVAQTESGEKPSEVITYHHPMASYNASLFNPSSPIQSFQNEWILHNPTEHFYAPYTYDTLVEHYSTEPQQDEPLQQLSLTHLIQFYQDPTQYFARMHLNMNPYRSQEMLIEDDELFTIVKGLDEYQLQQTLTDNILEKLLTSTDDPIFDQLLAQGLIHIEQNQEEDLEKDLEEEIKEETKNSVSITASDKIGASKENEVKLSLADHQAIEGLYQQFRLKGELPKFAFGKLTWQMQSQFAGHLAIHLREKGYPYGQFSQKRYRYQNLLLTAKLPLAAPCGDLIMWDVASLNYKRSIKTAILNLFLHATKAEDSPNTLWLYSKHKGQLAALKGVSLSKDEAQKKLNHLIRGYQIGIKAPIPFLYQLESRDPFFSQKEMHEVITKILSQDLNYPYPLNLDSLQPIEQWNPEQFITLMSQNQWLEDFTEEAQESFKTFFEIAGQSEAFKRLFPNAGIQAFIIALLFMMQYIDPLLQQVELITSTGKNEEDEEKKK